MFIALSKRHENIAEYILYIWQLEDLLRALQFSPEAIYSQLVKPHGLDAEKERQMMTWYMDIADLLQKENKEGKGHIEHTLHLISDLQRLHGQLMVLPAGEKYRSLYYRLMPEIPRLKKIIGKDEISDIEICFRALYAAMLYHIKNPKEADKITSDVTELVSPVIAELAAMFRDIETGATDLFSTE